MWNTLSFGPALVDGGKILAGIDSVEVDTNFGNHSVQGDQPRTGIGLVDDNHLLFVVVDGRSTGYSRGVAMTELARTFTDRDAEVAYNLDGGGSSAMVFNGKLVDNPLGRGEDVLAGDAHLLDTGTPGVRIHLSPALRQLRDPLAQFLRPPAGLRATAGTTLSAVVAHGGQRSCNDAGRSDADLVSHVRFGRAAR